MQTFIPTKSAKPANELPRPKGEPVYDLFIGIDPGTHTGFAVWDARAGRFLAVEDLRLHAALARVARYVAEGYRLKLIVEDARFLKMANLSREEKDRRQQGAGSVKRDCRIWKEFAEDYGIALTMEPPGRRMTKWDAPAFARATGWAGRTSQHGRDAALKVFGRVA